MNVSWMTLSRRKVLVTGLATLTLALVAVMTTDRRRQGTGKVATGDDRTAAARSEPFIPDRPEDTQPGQPANIPRRFLLEEADACRREEGEGAVQVVAYVHSAISRVEQRRQTRLTWANTTANNSALRMVVVFMVGRAKDDKEREIVQRESALYHDIVQGDYADHYHLLSYKALSSLYWITSNCAHVPWTLHSDDDLLIDTFLLQQHIQSLRDSPTRDQLQCRKLHEIIKRKGKWKVSKKELAGKYYPFYCQGTVWLLSTQQVPKLLEASASANFLWVDDAYITGVLALQANIEISDIASLIGVGNYKKFDIGKRMAWFHIPENRAKIWPLILKYHNASA